MSVMQNDIYFGNFSIYLLFDIHKTAVFYGSQPKAKGQKQLKKYFKIEGLKKFNIISFIQVVATGQILIIHKARVSRTSLNNVYFCISTVETKAPSVHEEEEESMYEVPQLRRTVSDFGYEKASDISTILKSTSSEEQVLVSPGRVK